MATSKSLLVQLVWATLICGQVFVSCKPQSLDPASSKSSDDGRESNAPPPGATIGKTKGFEIKNGYTFNVGNTVDGTFSSGWAYLGGRAGPGPVYYSDDSGIIPTEIWPTYAVDAATGGLYGVAAALAASSLWYTFSPFFSGKSSPPKKSSGTKVVNKPKVTTIDVKKEVPQEIKDSLPPAVVPAATVPVEVAKNAKKESRKRRDLSKNQVHNVIQSDADLTRLTSIVLNAIASGECLQKTICQLGTQIGESPKGRLAFSLVDTLLPASVHANQYFITMKKALKGEKICETFNCQYKTY